MNICFVCVRNIWMDANNWCNLRLINSTVCEANKFTTPEGIGILFAKQKFLFGEISGIYKHCFEKPFALSSMSKGLCLHGCSHADFICMSYGGMA